MSVNLFQKLFVGYKHTKLPSSEELNERLDKFADILAHDIKDNFSISFNIKWNRMVDDSGSSAKVIVTYNDDKQVNKSPFAPLAYKFDEPINLDPIKFNSEILNRLADKLNIGDGNHAGDIQLSVEDSNVSNPFDHDSLTTQAQLAFEVTLKDTENEKDE